MDQITMNALFKAHKADLKNIGGHISIGELSKRTGVGISTIRFYESLGLLPDPPRKKSKYRKYSEPFVYRLAFIREMRNVGFSLSEIKELIHLIAHPKARKAPVLKKIRAKIDEIRGQIDRLHSVKRNLQKIIT